MNKFYLKNCEGFSVWYIDKKNINNIENRFILKNLEIRKDKTFVIRIDYENNIAKELCEYLHPKFDEIQYEPDELHHEYIKMHNPYILISDEELLYIHLKYGSILKE